MKVELQSGTSDKLEWYKNHSMTEEQKRKLIERKINSAKQYLKAKSKDKALK